MKKFLSFITVMFLAITFANAQFSVILVDDDSYDGSSNPPASEAAPIQTALTNWGGTYSYWYIEDQGVPSYSDLQSYDMVIWFTGNSGANLGLWNVADTAGVGPGAVKFNDGLTQYVDAGGVLWIDGLDFLYDLYGGAPDDFAAGDFVYDKLGITQYIAQSHADDSSTGVEQYDKSSSNTITTVDPISWVYSTMWYADALAINSNAVALYQMGPTGYAFEGDVSAFYYNNIIVSGFRLSKIDPQGDIDQLISEMITAAEAGTFVASSSVNEISETNINIYPNPAANDVIINTSSVKNASELSIYDITGRNVYTEKLSGQKQITLNVSGFASGIYNIIVSGDNTVTAKFSVVK